MISENVSLKAHSTMRLGGNARYFTEVTSEDALKEAFAWAAEHKQPVRVIGTGSNIIWADEGFDGLVIVNKITGFAVKEDGVTISMGAGELWDDMVAKTVDLNLSGIEFLSLIPGTVGATPVQNVGAYGAEISDVLVNLRAFDSQTMQMAELTNQTCSFGYRTSLFKQDPSRRYAITSITLKLQKDLPAPPFYQSLQTYLDDHNVTSYSPQVIRNAVIAVRLSKLPDPSVVANCGSFFANPIIDKQAAESLVASYPELSHWDVGNGKVKVAAGWLVERAGFKGFHDPATGMATWEKQALVLVNEHAHSTQDLLNFKAKIVRAVYDMFGITLEQEPECI